MFTRVSINAMRMTLREMGWGTMDWINLAEDREQWRAMMNKVMNLWDP
jgi:hypothetical protein